MQASAKGENAHVIGRQSAGMIWVFRGETCRSVLWEKTHCDGRSRAFRSNMVAARLVETKGRLVCRDGNSHAEESNRRRIGEEEERASVWISTY